MMPNNRARQSNNDFDYDEIVKASSEHQKSLEEIRTQLQYIAQLVSPLNSKEDFALYFRGAIDSQVPLQNSVTDMVKKSLMDNSEVKKLIADEVKNVDRKWWNGAWKKVITGFGAVLLLIIGAIIGHYIK